MADILIKNMELPKGEDNNVYLIIGSDGIVLEKIASMYHVTTEAIALPEHGHGRLIDANRLKHDAETCRETTDAFIELIDNAPTIVEASNGTDN